MVGKTVKKLTVQDKLGIVILQIIFRDQTDEGNVFVCIKLKDLLSFNFHISDIWQYN